MSVHCLLCKWPFCHNLGMTTCTPEIGMVRFRLFQADFGFASTRLLARSMQSTLGYNNWEQERWIHRYRTEKKNRSKLSHGMLNDIIFQNASDRHERKLFTSIKQIREEAFSLLLEMLLISYLLFCTPIYIFFDIFRLHFRTSGVAVGFNIKQPLKLKAKPKSQLFSRSS